VIETRVVFAHGMSGFLKRFSRVLDGFPITPYLLLKSYKAQTVQVHHVEQRRLPASRHSYAFKLMSRSGGHGRRFGTTIDACRRPILCELQRLY
jgi:hypothetical protein